MCGISGYLDTSAGVNTAVLQKMNDVIRHRGPDDEGYALSSPAVPDFSASLLHACCEWGEDCLSHFNSMWGFALWGGSEHKLLCARDRLGQTNKMGFGTPIDLWRKQFSRDYPWEHVQNARTAPYFKMDFLTRLIDRQPDHPTVFEFLQTELFARQFDVS